MTTNDSSRQFGSSGVKKSLMSIGRLLPWILIAGIPVLWLLVQAVLSVSHLPELLLSARIWGLLLKSILVTLASTLIALILGGAAFIALEGKPWPKFLRNPLTILAFLGVFLPPYYQVALWRPWFGDFPIKLEHWRWPILIALLGISYSPVAFAFFKLGLKTLSPRVLESGLLLSSNRFSFHFRVLLPQLFPAIGAAGSLIGLLVLLNYEVGALLLMRLYPEAVFLEFDGNPKLGPATLFALPLFLTAFAGVYCFWKVLQKGFFSGEAQGGAQLLRYQPSWLSSGLSLLVGSVWLFAVVIWPLGRLLQLAGGTEITATFSQVWKLHGEEVLDGILVSVSATVVVIVMALLMVNPKNAASKVGLWISLTLALPGHLLGAALIQIYNQLPAPLDSIYMSPAILVIAQVARYFPLAYLTLAIVLGRVPRSQWEAGEILEPRPWIRFFKLRIPWATPGLALAGGLFMLLQSLELSASHLVAPPGSQPVAVTVYSLLHYNTVLEIPAGLCLIQFFITVILGGGLLGVSYLTWSWIGKK